MKYLRLFENFNGNTFDIEEMLNGYLETALWSGEEFDQNDVDDIAEESIESAKMDIDKFVENIIFRGCLKELVDNMPSSTIGHNFWLTRNGHGAGFWDSDLDDELGESLTKISEYFSDRHIYKGDDEKIYIE